MGPGLVTSSLVGSRRDLGGPATRQKAALPAGLPRTEGRDHGDKSLQPQPRGRPTEQVTSFPVVISVCLSTWPGLNAGASALHSPSPLACAPSGVPFPLIGLRLSPASVLTTPNSTPRAFQPTRRTCQNTAVLHSCAQNPEPLPLHKPATPAPCSWTSEPAPPAPPAPPKQLTRRQQVAEPNLTLSLNDLFWERALR